MDFPTQNQSRDIRVHTLYLIWNTVKAATIYDPGEKPCNLHSSGRKPQSELTAKTKGSDRIFTIKLGLPQSLMVLEGTHNLNVTL